MYAHKIKMTITADHQLSLQVPDDFPVGPVEIIILADHSTEQHIVKLASVLEPDTPPAQNSDPIYDSLRELRQEREQHFTEKLP